MLIFDFVSKTVTLNGTEIPYDGPMVPLPVGYGVVSFEFAGTVNADVTVANNRTYL